MDRRSTHPFASLAFGPASRVYEALTGSEPWRRSCRRLTDLVPGPLVLDLGAGPGESSLEPLRGAPARRVVALDLSAAMARRSSSRAAAAGLPLWPVRADAQRLPLRSASLDGVTGHSILYLLPDPATALAEVVRALRPGGRVAFLEPAAGAPRPGQALALGPRFFASMVLWRVMSGLHRRFDAPALAALLAASGLHQVAIEPALCGYAHLASATR